MVIKSTTKLTPARSDAPNAQQRGCADIEPLAVSILEACQVLGIKRSTIYREITAQRISVVKAGKRTLVPVAAMRAWLAALPKGVKGRE
jgi:excisionase family DNA binding protein